MIPFVGRQAERAQLAARWTRARAGQPQHLLVSGEAGIGKTRLVDDLLADIRRGGGAVLRGRCWDLGQAPAYWPWIQAFGSHLDEVGSEALLPLVADLDPALAQLLPRLGAAFRVPEAEDAGSGAAQLRLFDAVASLLRRLSASRPLALVLDDLEAADAASLHLLRFLARAGGGHGALTLALYRTPVRSDAAAAPALAQLEVEPAFERLPLTGLAAPEIGLMLEGMTGRPIDGAVTAEVHERTCGNPLFAAEFIRSLPPNIEPGRPSWSQLPSGVRGVIEQRLGALPARCRELLEVGAVSGREFDVPMVARVARTTTDELLAALDPALAAAVVAPVAGRPLRLVFCHPLFRECLHEGLGVVARAALHRDVGDTLRTWHAEAMEEALEVIASHYIAGLPVGTAPLALEYCQLAAGRASRLGARDEAVRLLELALEAVRALDDDGRHWCEVSLALAEALERAGRVREARPLFLQVADRAERIGLRRVMALAAAGVGGRLIWSRSVEPREIPLLERAFEGLRGTDLALRGLLLARLSVTSRDHARIAAMVRGARQAVELARLGGDAAVLTRTSDALVFALAQGGSTAEALAAVDDYQRNARASGESEHQVQALLYRAGLLLDDGDVIGAEGELAQATRMNEALRQPVQHWFASVVRAPLALLRGQLDRAEELADEVRRIGAEIQRPESAVLHLTTQYFVRLHQGRLADAEVVTQALAPFAPFRMTRVLAAHLAAMLDRREETRAFLDRHHRNDFAELLDTATHRAQLALLVEMADRAEHPAAAAALEPLFASLGHRYLAAPGVVWLGSARRYRGLTAALAGRHEEALALLTEAARENRLAGSTLWALRCDLDRARLLARGGDDRQARPLLEATAERARALGLGGLMAEAAALASAPAPPPRPTEAAFCREGEFWTIAFAAAHVRLRDSKGLRYLARLLSDEGRDVPALELMSGDGVVGEPGGAVDFSSMSAPGDLGPVLDRQARGELTRRLERIDGELADPARWEDLDAAERLQGERATLARTLEAAVGLGGRERRLGAPAERARQSVTKAIKGAMERIAREHQELGRHLSSTVRTGLTCRYEPDPRQPPRWRVQI